MKVIRAAGEAEAARPSCSRRRCGWRC